MPPAVLQLLSPNTRESHGFNNNCCIVDAKNLHKGHLKSRRFRKLFHDVFNCFVQCKTLFFLTAVLMQHYVNFSFLYSLVVNIFRYFFFFQRITVKFICATFKLNNDSSNYHRELINMNGLSIGKPIPT